MIPQPEVQQVDRDAAEAVYEGMFEQLRAQGHEPVRKEEVTPDDDDLIQAFARHRTAAFEAGRAEGVREARAECAEIAYERMPATQDMTSSYIAEACRDIADSIRALSKEPTK